MSDNIPQQHKDLLYSNPEKYRDYFEKTYGFGSASKVLQQLQEEKNEAENKRGVVKDVAVQAAGGIADAAQETLDFGAGITDAARKAGVPLPAYDWSQGKLLSSDEVLLERQKRIEQGLDESFIDLPTTDSPDTMAGGLTRGVVQFATGFIGVGKFTKLKNLKFLENKPFTRASIQGAAADAVVFDENLARFSDFINDYAPALSNPVTEYMAADPNDGFAEGRFKNALEGLMLGGAVETIFRLTRAFKSGKKVIDEGGDPKKLKKVIEKESKEIEKGIKKLDDELEDPKGINKKENLEIDKTEKPIRLKKNLVDEEVVKALTKNIERVKKGEMSYDEALDIPFNLNRISSEKDIQEGLAVLTEVIRKNAPDVFDGKESWNRVMKLADQLAEEPLVLMRKLSKLSGEMKDATAKVAATQIVLENLARLLPAASRQALLTGNDEKAKLLTEMMSKYLHDLKLITSGGARLTAFGRKATGGTSKKIDWLQDELKITGNFHKYLVKTSKLDQDPNVILKLIKSISKNANWDKPNHYWINAILSNPKTHIVNMTSNFVVMAMRPLEQMAGAAVTMNKADFLEGVDTLGGLFVYYKDALRAGKKALVNGESILDVGASKVEIPDIKATSKVGKGVAKVVGIPTRLLTAEDEFFKVASYNAKCYALALRSARTRGLNYKSKEFAEHVADYMKRSIDENTGGYANDVAMQYARENTFTQPLEGGMSQHVQRMVAAHPMLRQIIPFIRTPVNIYRAVAQRTPLLGAFQFQMREALSSPDPAIRAAAYGKQLMGTALFVSGYFMAKNGQITGGGSKNPEVKKAMLRTGWQPYSFRYGDKYYSYARIEPFSMILGIMADHAEISDDVDDKTLNELSMAGQMYLQSQLQIKSNTFGEKVGRGIMATAKNLSSKTYFKGLADILEALGSDQEWKWKRFYEGKVKSLVPNVLRNLNDDPYYKETRTFYDMIKSGIPSWSDSVEAKYNWLGKKDLKTQDIVERVISPFTVSEKQKDPLLEEIANLNIGLAPVSDKVGNIELFNFKKGDKNAYERLNELIEASDLEEELRSLIKSSDYQEGTESFNTDDINYKGSKMMLIQKVLRGFRKQAFHQLLEEGFISDTGLNLEEAYNNDRSNKMRVKHSLTDLLRTD